MAQQAEASAVSQLARAHEAAASAKAEAVERDAASKRALDDAAQRADAARRVSEEAGAADLFLEQLFGACPTANAAQRSTGRMARGHRPNERGALDPPFSVFFSTSRRGPVSI